MHYVYILYSPALDRFYVGGSSTPAQRLLHHNAGNQRYTRRASDWVQVFLKPTASRDEARQIEQSIKKSKSRETILRWIRGSDNQLPASIWKLFNK
jgi:putative endonuclease